MRTFSPKTQIPLDALFLRLRRNTHDNRQEQQGNDGHGPSNTQGNRMTGVRGNLRAVNHSKRSTLAEWTISVNDTKLHKNFTNTSRAFAAKIGVLALPALPLTVSVVAHSPGSARMDRSRQSSSQAPAAQFAAQIDRWLPGDEFEAVHEESQPPGLNPSEAFKAQRTAAHKP